VHRLYLIYMAVLDGESHVQVDVNAFILMPNLQVGVLYIILDM